MGSTGTWLAGTDSRQQAVLRLLVELGCQCVGADEGSLLVLDRDRQHLIFVMLVGPEASREAMIGQRVPVGKGVTGLAAQTHEVQTGAPTFGTTQPVEPKWVLAAPMLIEDRLVGVITAVKTTPDKGFTSDDAVLYGRVAAVAGVVVDQAHRLAVAEAAMKGQPLPEPADEQERLEREIIDAARCLARSSPGKRARLAKILAELAGLAAE